MTRIGRALFFCGPRVSLITLRRVGEYFFLKVVDAEVEFFPDPGPGPSTHLVLYQNRVAQQATKQ